MKVELVKYPTADDWMLCKRITLGTVGKDSNVPPKLEWKRKLLTARHSPIRTLNFVFKCEVPYWVSVHMVRHVHALPFISTQRTDRTGEDRTAKRQDEPVTMWYEVNAEEMMTIANKRLCNQASPETRQLVQMMCTLIVTNCPEFDGLLVPMCDFCGGVCHEFNGGCGRCSQ